MEALMYVLAKVVALSLDIVTYAMLFMVIMPLFVDVENSGFYGILSGIVEPFIVPFRYILYKLNIGQGLPIDVSFLTSYIFINLTKMALELFVPI